MNNQLQALTKLQAESLDITFRDDLIELARVFCQDQLLARLITIEKTTVPTTTAGGSPAQQFPLGQTGYWLQLERAEPLQEDEIAVARLLTSVLAAAPVFAPAMQHTDPIQLYQETQRELAQMSMLYQASAMMMANLEPNAVLPAVATEMVRALQVDSCTIFVWDEQTQQLHPQARKNLLVSSNEQKAGLGEVVNLEKYQVVRYLLDQQEVISLVSDQVELPEQKKLLSLAGLQSILLVPLVRRHKTLGVLAFGQVDQARVFTDTELRLAQNLATQAAVAIEHAGLFAEAQRRAKELATFQEIVLQLNTPLELKAVLDTITESALTLVEANNLHIYLYNDETEQFTFGSAHWRSGRRESAVIAPRPDGLTASVIKAGKPVVINDAATHPIYQSETSRDWGVKAIAGFPLRHGERIIGVFTVTYVEPHTFTSHELGILALLADQAAVAARNATLFDQSQRRLRDMAALVDMAKQVTGNLKLRSVLQTTVQILKELLNARASTITMLSEDKDELVVVAGAGINPDMLGKARMKVGEGVSGQVVRQGKLVYIQDAHSEPEFLFFDDVLRSLLVVPLVLRDETIGTLTIDSDQAKAFTESDVQLLTIAAAQVSVAIANARLFEDLETHAEELQLAYEEMKASDRLKDELVQNVSHELRTPLTFVKGYVDLLIEGEMGLVSENQQDALRIVAEKTDEITRLIEDIVTLQRIHTGNLQINRHSMIELVKTAVSSHRIVADKKGLKISYSVPDEEAMVEVDRGRINQVFANLIGNAMKFSPDGGTIDISLSQDDVNVCVIISDQGIGIPKEQQKRIFERFYQVDGSSRRRFGGTGVGLAIVKRIIDSHHGTVWVESELDQGSNFCFVLPKIQPETVDAI